MRSLFILIISLCCIAVWVHSVQAQDLTLESKNEGSLDAEGRDTYALTAREGQFLSFLAQARDDLDPILYIEDLNGNILLSNDDYDYPNSRDAIIEGFVAPYTGSYTVAVESYGATSGDYVLSMLPGYSTLAVQDTFDDDMGWDGIGLDIVNSPTVSVINGAANVTQEGIGVPGIAVGIQPERDVYFTRVAVDSITSSDGWRVGLVFGYQDEQNFYRVVVNFRGAWRLSVVRGGIETTIRDWNIHPAIVPDTQTFSLSVLVNEQTFDIFYNDQYIGSGTDENFDSGQIGLLVETVEAVGSTVTARFDSIIVTQPTLVDNSPIFPQNIIADGTNPTIRELQQRLLIPADGAMSFTLSESFAQNNREGVSRFAIGDGRTVGNFAIGAQVTWLATNADLNGCGLAVRDNDAEEYVLAYVDSEGGYGLSERSGAEFIQNYFNVRSNNMSPPHEIVLIVRDEQVHYYLDGDHAASMIVSMRDGSIAEAVINFNSVNTNCQFNNLWVWQW